MPNDVDIYGNVELGIVVVSGVYLYDSGFSVLVLDLAGSCRYGHITMAFNCKNKIGRHVVEPFCNQKLSDWTPLQKRESTWTGGRYCQLDDEVEYIDVFQK